MTSDYIDDAAEVMRGSGNEFIIVERSRDGKQFGVRMLCASLAVAQELAGQAIKAAEVVSAHEDFPGAAGDGADGSGQ